MVVLFIPFLIIGGIFLLKYLTFNNSTYKVASGNGFLKTVLDKGNHGEFLSFVSLEKLQGHTKLMTNLYIPKKDGSTTEIDLIMISQAGIFVVESKNYSGWIFGDEKSKNWTQTFKNGQKHRFFNPIWQNKGHISALKSVTDFEDDNLYKSYIVFSERCTLKNITVTSPNVIVLKRNTLTKLITRDMESSYKFLTIAEVNQLYRDLQKYVLVDDAVKNAHIKYLKARNL